MNLEVNNISHSVPSPLPNQIDQGTPFLDALNDIIVSTQERIIYACTHMESAPPKEANRFQHEDYASFVSVCLGILIVMLQVCRSSLNRWMDDTRKKMDVQMDKRRAQILGLPTEMKKYWVTGNRYYDFVTWLLAFYNRTSKIITGIYTFFGYIALAAGLVILYMGVSRECSVKTVLLLSPVAIWLVDVYLIRYGIALCIKIIGWLLQKNTAQLAARMQESNASNMNINSSIGDLEKKANVVAWSYHAGINAPHNNTPSQKKKRKHPSRRKQNSSAAGSRKP